VPGFGETLATLLSGKLQGVTQLTGIGEISWPLAVAVVSVLLELLRIDPAARRRARLYARVRRDFDCGSGWTLGDWTGRYGNLLLTAWMLDHWPHNLRSCLRTIGSSSLHTQIARHHELTPAIRNQLQQIFHTVAPRRSLNRESWRPWLDQFPETSKQLRVRAEREGLEHRRVRLIALAGLREGKSVKAVAAAIRYQPHTVIRWLQEGPRMDWRRCSSALEGGRC
jgi:hypothetical protein